MIEWSRTCKIKFPLRQQCDSSCIQCLCISGAAFLSCTPDLYAAASQRCRHDVRRNVPQQESCDGCSIRPFATGTLRTHQRSRSPRRILAADYETTCSTAAKHHQKRGIQTLGYLYSSFPCQRTQPEDVAYTTCAMVGHEYLFIPDLWKLCSHRRT